MGHHSFFQCIELLLRKVFVDVAPENFIFTAGFADDGFVFRSAASVLTGVDDHRAVI
jgi:hypothetical protein